MRKCVKSIPDVSTLFSNAERAADQLIAIWQGSLLMKYQLGLEATLSPEQLLDYVEDCVDTLLCAWKVPS